MADARYKMPDEVFMECWEWALSNKKSLQEMVVEIAKRCDKLDKNKTSGAEIKQVSVVAKCRALNKRLRLDIKIPASDAGENSAYAREKFNEKWRDRFQKSDYLK